MNAPHSDALVFFGVHRRSGLQEDLPVVAGMAKRQATSNVPVIGVAKAGLESGPAPGADTRQRREARRERSGPFDKLSWPATLC